MRQYLHIFFNALVFFTRLPAPSWVRYDAELQNKAMAWLPCIGLITGIPTALTFIILEHSTNPSLAALCALLLSVLITGAFHEDGLADTCDGFGGAWKTEDILRIMKDSSIGTYGAIGLMTSLLLRWQLMAAVLPGAGALRILVLTCLSTTASRFLAISLSWKLDYVSQRQNSKAHNLDRPFDWPGLWTAAAPVAVVLALLLSLYPGQLLFTLLSFALCCSALHYGLKFWYHRKIGGYTGDTLGAAQQVSEAMLWFWLALAVI